MKTWTKLLILFLVLLAQTGCIPNWMNQENLDEFDFRVDPSVKQSERENAKIIEQLELFLESKNESNEANEYWDPEDFERYRFPFIDLFEVENGLMGKYQYAPVLKEILFLGSKSMGYRLQIDFVGPNERREPILKMSVHLLAKIKRGKLVLARMVDVNTRRWQRTKMQGLEIFHQPDELLRPYDTVSDFAMLVRLQEFFELPPQPVRYFACHSIEKAYYTAGFKYHPAMYSPISKGPNELWNGNIFAGNHTQELPHEVSRYFVYQKFGLGRHQVLDRGLATFLNGYDNHSFQYYRMAFADERAQGGVFEYSEFFDTNKRKLLDKSIPYSYLIGALICEYVYRGWGKAGLFEMMELGVEEDDIWTVLHAQGLGFGSLNEKLDELLLEEPTLFMPELDVQNAREEAFADELSRLMKGDHSSFDLPPPPMR